MEHQIQENDQTAVFAEAFFIANLLFVGFFYVALWVLYFLRYKKTSLIGQSHLRQTLFASTISTGIFLIMNLYIIMTDGYASLTGLLSLELYFMLVAPVFLFAGIMGLTKAIRGEVYLFPLLRRWIT